MPVDELVMPRVSLSPSCDSAYELRRYYVYEFGPFWELSSADFSCGVALAPQIQDLTEN